MGRTTLRLTIRAIQGLPGANRDRVYWDSGLRGFGLKVTARGRRSFFVQYRAKDGKQRKPSLGVFPTVKPEAARQAAKEILSAAGQGKDPMAERAVARSEPTMAELFKMYLERHATRERSRAPPPITEAKRQIVEWPRPVVTQEVAALVEDGAPPFASEVLLSEDVRNLLRVRLDRPKPISQRKLAEALHSVGAAPIKQIRYGELRLRPWALHNHDRWTAASPAEIVAEINRGRQFPLVA
jgi:hypothetical protein